MSGFCRNVQEPVKSFQTSVAFHIYTSQRLGSRSICGINSNLPPALHWYKNHSANQLTGFYMGVTLACYGLTTSIDIIEGFVLVSFRAIISLIIKPFHTISKHFDNTLSNQSFRSFWYLPIFCRSYQPIAAHRYCQLSSKNIFPQVHTQ